MGEDTSLDLAATVERIVSLAERAGRERADVLRIEGEGGLSYASGLPVQDVEALLRGEPLPSAATGGGPVDPVEERHRQIVARILFLRRTRLRTLEGGGRIGYTLAEIAAGAGTSAQWLDKMIKTGKAPNLDHAAGIAAFFGERIEFLVDPPARALDRVLQQIHMDLLERTVERQDKDLAALKEADPTGYLRSELGIVGYAARALADVPEDTAQPIIALIESIARRSREERARENRADADS
ncbi:hypothetical protein AMK16_26930 [Streptomyces sp. CB00455]|uniref:hypothetical protein n=1 Tax=Streptomyces sp. CB00455 TaxID=1703927 RepID=UPI00093A3A6D|nr:hypothetical protein [Streptomyces sp. CB00455]OKK16286.1 hypothetical protein AMK16_26930 [Streptomyces sp. CB00455]